MTPEQFSGIGADLAVLGTIVSCCGVAANNLYLDHTLAMQIWVFSNIILGAWAFGLYKRYWDGGISGAALFLMYGFMLVTGVWGLMK
jgi:hypothetical protein